MQDIAKPDTSELPLLLAAGRGERFSMPLVTVERSRKQVLCRSGFTGKKQSFSLKYGAGHPYPSEADALAVGKAWVAEERVRQGV